jgi:hypothetical protein
MVTVEKLGTRPGRQREETTVQIDCDTCEVRGDACGDCVVTFLLGAPPEGVDIDAQERQALEVLAASGLVPPLRLVPPGGRRHAGGNSGEAGPARSVG